MKERTPNSSLREYPSLTSCKPRAPQREAPLFKQRSWSPETLLEEAWYRRQNHHKRRRSRRCKCVTDDDLDKLRACFELGFRFDSPDPKLTDTLPAVELYHIANKQYSQTLTRSSTVVSDSDSSIGSPSPTFDSGLQPNFDQTA
ncbi:uncharacterized protein LOC130774121 [Actinidia eriantha]|uniref:uncharacterized protein LOC130774121 n=1 Tax=Actinidia eriantha TaxID=165200 RepID=UPI00258CB217|nr:uncharacterized protein LOC130774121 [Actinidia eriantha]